MRSRRPSTRAARGRRRGRLMDLEPKRFEYEAIPLDVDDVDPDPVVQVRRWTADVERGIAPKEPSAAVLATAGPDGQPGARNVLVRDARRAGLRVLPRTGRVARSQHLAATGKAALLFSWVPVNRQIEPVGAVAPIDQAESRHLLRVPARAEPDRRVGLGPIHRAARPGGARGAASGPWRSASVTGRCRARPTGAATGWCRPRSSSWQGRPNRLHDRLRYTRDPRPPGGWRLERLKSLTGQVVAAATRPRTTSARWGMVRRGEVGPERRPAPHPRGQLELHTALGAPVHRVGPVHPAQLRRDGVELVDHDVAVGERGAQVLGHVVGEGRLPPPASSVVHMSSRP